jgi:hypothetical protein
MTTPAPLFQRSSGLGAPPPPPRRALLPAAPMDGSTSADVFHLFFVFCSCFVFVRGWCVREY